MNDSIMMIMVGLAFVITQIGITGLIYMWYRYRYGLMGRSKDDDLNNKANGEVLSRVIRFKPKSDVKIKDKKGKFGQGFEGRRRLKNGK